MAALTPAPYITPEILTNAVTGIEWRTIPARNSTPAQQLAEQWNICRRATAMIDIEVNQRLRATLSTELLLAPDYRVTIVPSSRTAYIILARKPILEVVSGAVAYNAPPLNWQPIPANAFVVNQPSPGVYGSSVPGDAGETGQTVTLAAGYVSWWSGRKGQFLKVTYVSGYPHCVLTKDVAAGASALPVDDCTGWAPAASGLPGASGNVYDAGNEEVVSCLTTSAAAGPGDLLLASPTSFAHQQGTLITSLPPALHQAAILFAVSQALVRGATASAQQTISAAMVHGDNPATYASEAELLCKPYKRIT